MTAVVSVEELTKRFGTGATETVAVDDVSFSVEHGAIVGLLGPNGAGKTTLIKSILGLITPTTGSVAVCGADVRTEPRTVHRHTSAMLEGARNVYWRLTVRDNLRFFTALQGRRPTAFRGRHDELLDRFDLTAEADTIVRKLSRGMKQKVSLVCTLAQGTELVVLDEPTLGLDLTSTVNLRRELRQLVRQESMTVLLSSHDMEVIEAICDRVIIMRDGTVVADDTVAELLSGVDARPWELRVRPSLSSTDLRALRTAFDIETAAAVGGHTRFTVRLTSERFYELVEFLQAREYLIVEADTGMPDLAEVFLDVTERETTSEPPSPRSGQR